MGSSSITLTHNFTHSFLNNRFSTRINLTGTGLNRSISYIRLHQFHGIHHQIRNPNAFKTPPVADMENATYQSVEAVETIEDRISYIKDRLNTIEDGRISVSPYNTAWIALIKSIDGPDLPQFPSSLTWIVQNQLPGGSWGDPYYFNIYDRLVNTIACIIALKSWNVHPRKIEKGVSYMKQNIWRLEDAKEAHMTCGFEVIFPSLLGKARQMGIHDLPYDTPLLNKIYAVRDQKLKRIPREVMHEETTTLLYSLEAFEDLDWSRLLKLQSVDGSFFTSPSATAFAFMHTQNPNCLKFITTIVQKFNGGAPHTYPVDFFARLWAVDRLQRLGISRFFASQIEDCLSYIYRFWNEKGIFSARNLNFSDVDDTSMGFRLLRLHGFDVNPDVLKNFKEGSEFYCHSRELTDSITPTYALYRASQIRFPGEYILEEAYNFSYNCLRHWLAGDQPLDKWIVTKNLHDEIKIGLEIPWYASLPRVEAWYYLQHYGGSSDVWIAKTLYRMPDICNDEYLNLATLDFKRCQAQHQIEWSYMQGWYENLNGEGFGISRRDLLVAYFLAAATIFEPERAKERIAWAKSQLICRMIRTLSNSIDRKESKSEPRLNILLQVIHELSEGFGECISRQLEDFWGLWLRKLIDGDSMNSWRDAELFVTTLNICSHQFLHNGDILFHQEYTALSKLTNKICHHLSQISNKKVEELSTQRGSMNEIEEDLQALMKLVLEESNILNKNIKQNFLLVTKTFYYSAYFDAETIDFHIFKVLFEPIV